jgi:glycosyltransferase involved in cell wall biosynthesis
MNNPLISIYMPTKNRFDLVCRAIDSVLNQTYKNIELIVVDDGSEIDQYERLVKEFFKNENVIILRNEISLGACASRNKAIEQAKGEYVTGLDDDDYFAPERIEFLFKSWNNKPKNCIGIYSDFIAIEEDGKKDVFLTNKCTLNDLFISNKVGNQIFTLTSMYKLNGGFDEKLKSWQDLDMWINILHSNPKKNFYKSEGKGTYFFDKSHPHERISTSKFEKHIESSKYIEKKYGLNFINQNRLRLQAYLYNSRAVGIKNILFTSVLSFNFYCMARALKYYCLKKKIA